eukprot:1143073-Pelagomonas_calceolata.AAC.3
MMLVIGNSWAEDTVANFQGDCGQLKALRTSKHEDIAPNSGVTDNASNQGMHGIAAEHKLCTNT